MELRRGREIPTIQMSSNVVCLRRNSVCGTQQSPLLEVDWSFNVREKRFDGTSSCNVQLLMKENALALILESLAVRFIRYWFEKFLSVINIIFVDNNNRSRRERRHNVLE